MRKSQQCLIAVEHKNPKQSAEEINENIEKIETGDSGETGREKVCISTGITVKIRRQ